jgi:hypothetical protein
MQRRQEREGVWVRRTSGQKAPEIRPSASNSLWN